MMNTAKETKETIPSFYEACGYSRKHAWQRIKRLRARYGVDELSKRTGIKPLQIQNYCSEAYLRRYKNALTQDFWEKHFGKWELKEPDFPYDENGNPVRAIVQIPKPEKPAEVETPESEKVEPEPVEEVTPEAPKKARLVLEVPSLAELDSALEEFGMELEIFVR